MPTLEQPIYLVLVNRPTTVHVIEVEIKVQALLGCTTQRGREATQQFFEIDRPASILVHCIEHVASKYLVMET